MYTLVLAEKPDQAREYAKALSKDVERQKSGTLVIKNSQYYPGEIHIVAARGHIMNYDLKPDKRWSFAKLPIVNPGFTFKVADSTDAKYRFKQIKQEATQANLIIIGTDADREGERIAYSILSKLPMATRKKATKRLWVNSMTAKGIQHSFQSLYQKKYLTYPRTDCRYITNLEFAYLRENLAAYQKALNLRFNAVNLQARSKYVNDKKVQEHFAIIPTDVVPNLAKLTADERLVYETVVKRTCLMFAADYKYKLTRVIIKVGGVLLGAEGKQVVDLGFKQYLSESNSEPNQLLPNYQVGQQLQIKPQLTEDKTRVPSRITEAKLIGTLFPKYSLGTPATRAGIIERILEKKYVTKNGKGELYPTGKAEVLMNYLKTNSVADPNTTKIWEEGLKLIGQGKLDGKLFVDKIQEEIVAQVNEIKARYGK